MGHVLANKRNLGNNEYRLSFSGVRHVRPHHSEAYSHRSHRNAFVFRNIPRACQSASNLIRGSLYIDCRKFVRMLVSHEIYIERGRYDHPTCNTIYECICTGTRPAVCNAPQHQLERRMAGTRAPHPSREARRRGTRQILSEFSGRCGGAPKQHSATAIEIARTISACNLHRLKLETRQG